MKAEFALASVPATATVRWSCDNKAELVLNGKDLGLCKDWDKPMSRKLDAGLLKAGKNTLSAKVRNDGAGAAAFLLEILDTSAKPAKVLYATGQPGWKWTEQVPEDWKTNPQAVGELKEPVLLGEYGVDPWGRVFDGQEDRMSPEAAQIKAPAGFKVELVYSVPKAAEGSWVSLTVDAKGRFIAGDQDGKVYRLTMPAAGDANGEPTVEVLEIGPTHAQGLLWHDQSLYVVTNGPKSGLYRCWDADGDGKFEKEEVLKRIDGDGEHGPHQVVLGPDGKSLFVAGGNHTKLPEVQSTVVPPLWQEDILLPRMWDANGHAVNIFAPGGWFARTDLDGKHWTTFSVGFRNQYDIAFSPTGEAFTYDSDMEWDVGMPWYRPTRINHVTPGSEHGWRSGSGVWPTHYLDSLAPVTDIGPGSPTGCVFGTGAKFPEKYQKALFAADWTYGTLYAVHMAADGSGFTGEKEAFITGKPLPLSDVVVHPDGAMYLLVGGRKVQSGLYRVTYTGSDSTAPVAAVPPAKLVKQRLELEALLAAPPSAESVKRAIASLGHRDRLIRFTARTLLELQPLNTWEDLAFAEVAAPTSTIDAMLCLSRVGGSMDPTVKARLQPKILDALRKVHNLGLREGEMLDLLRTYSVCFMRLGKPTDEATLHGLREQFEPMFPSPSDTLNKEVAELLVYLDSRQIVGKLVVALQTAASDTRDDALASEQLKLNEGYAQAFREAKKTMPNRRQITVAYALQYAKEGWTPELRRMFFRWFGTASRWAGGNSFHGFIANIYKQGLKNVPEDLRAEMEFAATGQASDALLAKLGKKGQKNTLQLSSLPTAKGPGKAYDMDMLMKLATPERLQARHFENGKKMYQAALCSSCHRMGNEYGGVGPDLTGIAARYSMRDLLENIVIPSKVISDQYSSSLIEKNDGSSLVGRVVMEGDDWIRVAENPLLPENVTEVKVGDIKTRNAYPVSAMPPALFNNLNEEEVLDLLAFLLSGGNEQSPVYGKGK